MMLRLALFLLTLLSLPDGAGAATRFLDATACTGNYSIANRNCTGSDGTSYATISAGLQATTTAGDNLWIRSGTYTATIVSADYTSGGTSWSAPITIGGCPASVCGSAEYPTINTTAGNLVNLTTAANKYTILMRLILDATSGRVSYQFGVGELAVPSGIESAMRLNVVVTDAGGKVLTQRKPITYKIRKKI